MTCTLPRALSRSLELSVTPLLAVVLLLAVPSCGSSGPGESREPSAAENDKAPKKPSQADDRVADGRPADQAAADKASANATAADAEPARTVTLGKAKVTLGDRPPWADTAELQQNPDFADAPAAPDLDAPLPKRWKLVRSIRVGVGYLYQAEFTADGKSVVTMSTDSGLVYRYKASSGKSQRKYRLPSFEQFDDAWFAVVRETPNRPRVFIARESGTQILDLKTGKFSAQEILPPGDVIEHTGRFGLYGVAFRNAKPQGGRVSLRWLDGAIAATMECAERPDDFSVSADGRMIAIRYYPSDTIEILDLAERRLVSIIKTPRMAGDVALSPDGKTIAIGGSLLLMASVADGQIIATDERFAGNLSEVRFTPQGDLLLVSAFDGKVRSYALPEDLATMTSFTKPQVLKHRGRANVYGLGLSADTRRLLTSSGDRTVKIWKR